MLDEDFATLLAEHPTGAGITATTPADADEPDEGDGAEDGTDPADADSARP